MKIPAKIINTTVRMSLSLREQAEAEADSQGQTYSGFMRTLLIVYLREKKSLRPSGVKTQ